MTWRVNKSVFFELIYCCLFLKIPRFLNLLKSLTIFLILYLITDYLTGAKIPRFADISHPIFKLHEREYKNYSNPKCQILIFDWSANDPLADVFLTKFGKIPIDEAAGVDYSAMPTNSGFGDQFG